MPYRSDRPPDEWDEVPPETLPLSRNTMRASAALTAIKGALCLHLPTD